MTEMDRLRQFMLDTVERECTEQLRAEEQLAEQLRERTAAEQDRQARKKAEQRRSGPSVVLTVRLGHDELDALERRAALFGLPTRALARNLIRRGLLATPQTGDLAALVDELQSVAGRLRRLAP